MTQHEQRRASDKKGFLARYTAVIIAIGATFTVLTATCSVMAWVLLPRLDDRIESKQEVIKEEQIKIKKECDDNMAKLEKKLKRLRWDLRAIMTEEQIRKSNRLYREDKED
jgi:uncharacterized membrane protein YhiD involved in acid resistance